MKRKALIATSIVLLLLVAGCCASAQGLREFKAKAVSIANSFDIELDITGEKTSGEGAKRRYSISSKDKKTGEEYIIFGNDSSIHIHNASRSLAAPKKDRTEKRAFDDTKKAKTWALGKANLHRGTRKIREPRFQMEFDHFVQGKKKRGRTKAQYAFEFNGYEFVDIAARIDIVVDSHDRALLSYDEFWIDLDLIKKPRVLTTQQEALDAVRALPGMDRARLSTDVSLGYAVSADKKSATVCWKVVRFKGGDNEQRYFVDAETGEFVKKG